ncbi:hypothetical protein [Cohnella soli]|uniref:Uncharacterized protein n=1 Tax=Cohnella soli TaxID=425005 RepID=A0ABW0HKY5_9BACL
MSNYSNYVINHVPRPPIVPTDWEYVRNEFDDIIEGKIENGNYEGDSTYPQIRKTINLKYGCGTLHASEYIEDKKGAPQIVLRFEYDWQFEPANRNAIWKFHYDTYHPKELWPTTINFHEHDEPTPIKTQHKRHSNFGHRDICSVLGTIRVAMRVSGKLPIPQ